MNLLSLSPLALLTLPGSPAEDLVLRAEAGRSFVITVERGHASEVVDSEVVFEVDGEEQDVGAGGMDMRAANEERVVVRDTVVAAEDGTVLGIEREFRELGGSSEFEFGGGEGFGPEDSNTELVSQLEGQTVVFEREDEDADWVGAFAEGSDGDGALLERLTPGSHLAFLLPGEPVEVGDSWEVGEEAWDELGEPLGFLVLHPEDVDMDFSEDSEDAQDEPESETEVDSFELTLASVEDGVATIDISISVTTTTRGEMEMNDEMGGTGVMTLHQVDEQELEGTLTWSVRGGHPIALELEGTGEEEVENEQESETPFGAIHVWHTQTMEGTSWLRMTFELDE